MDARRTEFLLFCLLVLLILVSPAESSVLLNGSFEQLGRYWDMDGGGAFAAYDCPDSDMYCLGSGTPTTAIYQQVELPSSVYKLDFSAFYRISYSTDINPVGTSGPVVTLDPGEVSGYIVVDGTEVAGAGCTGPDSLSRGFHDTGWLNSAFSWTGYVASTVGVRIVLNGTGITYAEGQGGFGSYADAVVLDASPVPEPTSAFALCFGVMLSAVTSFNCSHRQSNRRKKPQPMIT
jgi:hypothetical protein